MSDKNYGLMPQTKLIRECESKDITIALLHAEIADNVSQLRYQRHLIDFYKSVMKLARKQNELADEFLRSLQKPE